MRKDLNELVVHAFNTVPFYRDFYKNIDMEQINYHTLPILTKQLLLDNTDALISNKYDFNALSVEHTSGSTGMVLKIYWDNFEYIRSNLNLWAFRKKTYDIGPINRCLSFHAFTVDDNDVFEKPKFIYRGNNNLSLCKLYLDEDALSEYFLYINDFKPEWINASPCIMNLFFNYMQKHGLRFPSTLKYIEVSGEYFPETYRKNLNNFFKLNIVNQYGCREANSIAIECKYGHLHCLTNTYIEVMDKYNRPLDYGLEGRILLTNLMNKAMPIIRYDLGDQVTLHDGRICPCGNANPIIELNSCRVADYIFIENREPMYCMFFIYVIGKVNALNDYTIRQHQIVQNDYKHFTVNLSTDKYCNKDKLIKEFVCIVREHLPENVEWEFKFFDYLFPDNMTGKMKYFINDMQNLINNERGQNND